MTSEEGELHCPSDSCTHSEDQFGYSLAKQLQQRKKLLLLRYGLLLLQRRCRIDVASSYIKHHYKAIKLSMNLPIFPLQWGTGPSCPAQPHTSWWIPSHSLGFWYQLLEQTSETWQMRNRKGDVLVLLPCISSTWCHCHLKLDPGNRSKWRSPPFLSPWFLDLDISWGPAAKKLLTAASQALLSCIALPL